MEEFSMGRVSCSIVLKGFVLVGTMVNMFSDLQLLVSRLVHSVSDSLEVATMLMSLL